MTVSWKGEQMVILVSNSISRGLTPAGNLVMEEAKRLIRSPKSGRTYTRRGKRQQASAPGEPPASVTGRLLRSFRVKVDKTRLIATVSANIRHAPWLEHGTRRMAPRPFMRPAARNVAKKVKAFLAREVSRALKGRS